MPASAMRAGGVAGDDQGCDRDQDERRHRRVRSQHQHFRRTEDCVGHETRDRRVEARHRGKSRQLRIGHALGDQDRRQDDSRHQIRSKPPAFVVPKSHQSRGPTLQDALQGADRFSGRAGASVGLCRPSLTAGKGGVRRPDPASRLRASSRTAPKPRRVRRRHELLRDESLVPVSPCADQQLSSGCRQFTEPLVESLTLMSSLRARHERVESKAREPSGAIRRMEPDAGGRRDRLPGPRFTEVG